jgi:hypothetical protein
MNSTPLLAALIAVKTELAYLYHNGRIKANAPERERIQILLVNAEYAIEKAEENPANETPASAATPTTVNPPPAFNLVQSRLVPGEDWMEHYHTRYWIDAADGTPLVDIRRTGNPEADKRRADAVLAALATMETENS